MELDRIFSWPLCGFKPRWNRSRTDSFKEVKPNLWNKWGSREDVQINNQACPKFWHMKNWLATAVSWGMENHASYSYQIQQYFIDGLGKFTKQMTWLGFMICTVTLDVQEHLQPGCRSDIFANNNISIWSFYRILTNNKRSVFRPSSQFEILINFAHITCPITSPSDWIYK